MYDTFLPSPWELRWLGLRVLEGSCAWVEGEKWFACAAWRMQSVGFPGCTPGARECVRTLKYRLTDFL